MEKFDLPSLVNGKKKRTRHIATKKTGKMQNDNGKQLKQLQLPPL